MKGPGQGVFVKNPEYAGEEDEYDFYFTDDYNHCVRVLTPTGRVYTFAGRGNGRNCFYVGERNNKVIRKIALEE